jgi:hypothetical protein
MRTIATATAAAALTLGALLTAQTAHAGQTTHDTTVSPQPPTPTVQLLDCDGGTGRFGCGPGFFWRNGERGFACYPC